MRKRLLACVLALAMATTLLPMSVFAVGEGTAPAVKYGEYVGGAWKETPNGTDTVTEDLPTGVTSISKTAEPTNIPNQYTVKLKVEMEQKTETTPPGAAATVLVMDCSTSMRGSSISSAKAAAISFLKAYSGLKNFDANGKTTDTQGQNLSRFVSVVWFGTLGGVQQQWVDVSNPKNYNDAVKQINKLDVYNNQGTNLDGGLRFAEVLLSNNSVAQISSKNVVVLTDGEPTFYMNEKWYFDHNGSVNIGGTTFYAYGEGNACDQSTFDTTNKTANFVKQQASVYTVCFGAENTKMTKKSHVIFEDDYWPFTVGEYLKNNIATAGTQETTYAYNAADADQLNKAFAAISSSVITGLNAGTVTDTLPAAVTADNGFKTTWELKPEEATKTVDGDKTTYTWKTEYTVTIDPTKVAAGEEYQPLNGVTKLTVKGGEALFPIPAGKVTKPTYTVKYVVNGDVTYGKPYNNPASVEPTSDNVNAGQYTLKDVLSGVGYTTATKDEQTVTGSWSFTGWCTDANCATAAVTSYNVTTDVTFYGKWTFIPTPTYDVTYIWAGLPTDADSWTTENPAPERPKDDNKYTAGTECTVNTKFSVGDTVTTAKGDVYVFTGWQVTTPASGATITDGKITMPAANVTLTGTWTKQGDATYSLSDKIYKTLTLAEGAAFPEGQNLEFEVTVTPKTPTTGNAITGTATVTKDNYDSVAFDFGRNSTLTFNAAGTYTYTVKEVIPQEQGNIAYDTSTYTLTIEVKKEGTDLKVASATATKDGATITATEGSDAEVTPATDKLITFTNKLNKPTPAPTTGTLTITKYVTDIHAQDQSEVQAAANGKVFSFTVTGANGSFLKNVVYSNQESAKNSVEFTNLPAGEYTVTETYYPLVLGSFEKENTKLFKWSYSGTSYAPNNTLDFSYGSTYTATVTAGDTTDLVCFNRYDSWKDGIGKSATNLDSNYISNVTLTLTGQKFEHESEISSAREKTTYTEYSIPAGAQVKDFMGYTTDYNFDLVDISKMTVTVTNNDGTETYPAVALTGKQPEVGNDWQYGFHDVGDGYFAYYVKYQKASDGTEHFVWMTRDRIEEGTTVQINYSVKLMNPKTASDTYGQFDPYGEYNYAELLTNNSAILYEEFKWEAEGGTVTTTEKLIATFPQPTVSYKISNNGGGGGGHSRPTLNTEDHYGYVIGYPDGTVQPGGSITRAEVATIFFRMLTDSSRTEFWSQTNSFSDVPSTAWFNNAVSTLTKAGIIAGYEDGTFQPNATITRAEFATIAVRFFEASYDGKDFFTDIDGHWAQQYINDAANAGLVNGYEDGTFGPNKAITRAEAMTLVNRALDRHPDADHFLKDMITWPDNSDTKAWYYEAVQEATNSHEYTMKTNTDKTKYENWTKMLKMRDWKAFEAAWSNANSASNPGEVMGK